MYAAESAAAGPSARRHSNESALPMKPAYQAETARNRGRRRDAMSNREDRGRRFTTTANRAMPTSSAAAAGLTHVHDPTPRISTATRQVATSSQIMRVVAAAERATGT